MKVITMSKIFAYPLVALVLVVAAPSMTSIAYAQSSDTQTEDQKPAPESGTEKPSDN